MTNITTWPRLKISASDIVVWRSLLKDLKHRSAQNMESGTTTHAHVRLTSNHSPVPCAIKQAIHTVHRSWCENQNLL